MATKSKKQNPVKIGRVNLDNPAERKRGFVFLLFSSHNVTRYNRFSLLIHSGPGFDSLLRRKVR